MILTLVIDRSTIGVDHDPYACDQEIDSGGITIPTPVID